MSTSQKLRLLLVTLSVVMGLSGCSAKQLYNATQENRLQTCSELYGAQREECEAQYQKDYETYERERQQVINAKKPVNR
ncbi:hypothetical protein [Alteromonas oceanisediminis]|uniref:hypothetical protein n=1 Tax=Alteromonas oceanisediminis TaxID=2836180 RepID=UPI001BDB43D3|nr:hypothetical protein [Alteromonas oceanisediminis]MBT0587467.1 hypothetical protein [Alteromonas oceanisediminis]